MHDMCECIINNPMTLYSIVPFKIGTGENNRERKGGGIATCILTLPATRIWYTHTLRHCVNSHKIEYDVVLKNGL